VEKTTVAVAELAGLVDEKYQRGISPAFEAELTEGVLRPILQRLQHDDTLSLEIRNGYIDIYYRGGRLLEVRATASPTRFTTAFDDNYCGDEEWCPKPPPRRDRIIASTSDAQAWVDVFAAHKQIMDIHFCKRPKIEREYQQAVVRDNNRHSTGERSDYVVLDVEYAQSSRAFGRKADFRFDMIGFRWPLTGGGRGRGIVTPAIMEMKAGDAALAASCGLAEHVEDIEAFLTPKPGESCSGPYLLLCAELIRSFAIKQRLGLPSLPKRVKDLKITEVTIRPQVVFVVANHRPVSKVLHRELRGLQAGSRADYLMATVEHAGYALFAENMVPLDKFIERLLQPPATAVPLAAEPAAAGQSRGGNGAQGLKELAAGLDVLERVDASAFQRRARVLQSMWRQEQGIPCGEHVGPSGARPLGSRLPMPWAQETLANFLTEQIRSVVRAEVCDPVASSGKLYGKPRIFCGLLSSQPLCFNLFGELALDLPLASAVVDRLSKGRFTEVTSIEFEVSPGRGDPRYLNDRSAFDVFIRCRNASGGSSFIAVEVKYHENLIGTAGAHKPRYDEVADLMGCFASDHQPLRSSPLQQLWRDHLLAGITQIEDGYDDAMFVVLYPKDNTHVSAALGAYREQLSRESSFAAWTLEDLVESLRGATEATWVDAFTDRYLAFGKVDQHLRASD
jgi:hypothetical protein